MNSLHKINTFLICLIPFFLVTGPFIPDFVATYLGIFFLFFCVYNNNFTEYKNFFFIFFIIFYLYLNLNSIFSFNSKISFQSSLPYLRVVLFIFCLSFYIKKNLNLLKFFYFINYFLLLFLLADSLVQFSSGYNIFKYKIDHTLRVSSFFGKELIMGSFVSRLLPILIGISYLINLNYRNYLNITLLSISGVLVVLSSERLAFFFFIVTIFFYLIIEFNKKNLIFLLIGLTLTSLTFFINQNSYKIIFVHTYDQIAKSDKIIGFSERHVMHYLTAYEMFLEKKILGHGLKSFRYLCSNDDYLQKLINRNLKKYDVVAKENGYIGLMYGGNIKLVYENGTNENYKRQSVTFYNQNNYYYEGVVHWDFLDIYYPKINNNLFFLKPFKKDEILFINYDVSGRCNTHPHNIYLQFLSEIGLIGFFFLLIIFFYIAINLFKIFYKLIRISYLKNFEKSKFFNLISIFLPLIPILPSGNYFNNWMLIISYFPLGIYLFQHKKI